MSKKEKVIEDSLAEFKRLGGGTNPTDEIDSEVLAKGLEDSFQDIFPELLEKTKSRRHIMLDSDVEEALKVLTKGRSNLFSKTINVIIREFMKKLYSQRIKSTISDDEAIIIALEEAQEMRNSLEALRAKGLDKRPEFEAIEKTLKDF